MVRQAKESGEKHTFAAPATNDLFGVTCMRGTRVGGELADVVSVVVFVGVGHVAEVDGDAGTRAFKVPAV